MVGSGFSRNAERNQPSALALPTWRGIAEAICHRLYPDDKDGHETSAVAASSETSSALKLAQEYEAAFGRTDLHSFLQQLIRDDEFTPGRMHGRLLRLPWRDVFTTNWDTLLERACSSVPDRSYGLMRNTDEVPLSARPRIVKLHGSVNAHFPLIITEEDYRTYPARFAPFVNTTQQAMMETVFCLIGFSGDDPNFLHWSGWVRDNLGTSAPKIYLAGWLDLSIHRRRMFEERNVVPIDLARHPKAGEWPEQLRHERSTDWLLHTLEYGRPYDISNWPSTSARVGASVPEYLEPVCRKATSEPKAEPESTSDESAEKKIAAARRLLSVWSYNRTTTYPGWLTAPADVRRKMWSTREKASLILDVLPSLASVDRLNALRELIWRWEIQLEPISTLEPESSHLEEAARYALAQIDCQSREIDGEPAATADWTAISEAWVSVASALATAVRFRFDIDEFDRRLLALLPFQDNNQDIGHRIRHERCLWAIYSLDYKSLEGLLGEWHTEDCDPVWMMRKAALLFEIGQHEKAQELNTAALAAIRSSPADDDSVALRSREAWALCCAGSTMEFEESWHASLEWWRRWEELTPLKCNAPLEMRYYAEAIEGHSHFEKGPHFDLGKAWKQGITFSQAEPLRWVASHRVVRVAEVVGLPPSVPTRVVASTNLELAARQLWPHEPELAARLVLRVAKHETTGTLNFVLSRALVATISQEVANRLAEICVDAIEFMLSRIAASNAGSHWMTRLPVIIEALSRFVLRLDPERVDSIFRRALGWYEDKVIATAVGMADPIRNILARSWEALPEEQQMVRILDLLSAPIVGLDGFTAGIIGEDGRSMFVRQYPDPCDILQNSTTPKVLSTSGDKARWNDVIGILVRGLRSTGEARRRAARRMSWLVDFRSLTADEESEVALVVWGEDYASHNKLPAGTDIHDWAFSVLPEPKPGLAEQRFRAKWLNPPALTASTLPTSDKILWQVGSAINNLKVHGKPLSLSDEERSYLADVVGRWAQKPIPNPLGFAGRPAPVFAGGVDDEVRDAISGLKYVLLEVDVSEAVANTLYEKVQVLNTSEMPARAIAAGLIRALPDRFEDIVQSMRMGLASDDDQVAKDAAGALEFWLHSGKDMAVGLAPPPTDVIQEIGVIIATRRKAALIQALRIARWVLSEGSPEQREAIRDLAAQGLGYLAQELRYDESHDGDIDLPLLRWGCTHLAIVMAEHGFDAEPAVARWVANSRDDPLPEIRHAKGPVSTLYSDG